MSKDERGEGIEQWETTARPAEPGEDVPTTEPIPSLSLRVFRNDGTIEDLGEVNKVEVSIENEVA